MSIFKKAGVSVALFEDSDSFCYNKNVYPYDFADVRLVKKDGDFWIEKKCRTTYFHKHKRTGEDYKMYGYEWLRAQTDER